MSVQNYSGQQFGQYELSDLLGVGGMGSVYRAYQAGLRRTVAVKVLPLMRGEEYAKRFIREATTSAALEHAHIIPIYDFGTEKGVSYIVMRLLTGGSLADRIDAFLDEGKALPSLSEISAFLRQLASALDYAHGKGVIHRDIKPSNVMFDDQGSAYLVDFGIAKLSDATGGLTGTNMTVGTPQYMPPEQWRGEEVGPASDQYALAVMVYHLVTGQLPFEAPTPYALMHKHVYETPPTPNMIRADLPPGITEVLNRALAKTPTERYPSVMAFAQAFEQAIQGVTNHSGNTGMFVRPLPAASSGTVLKMPDSAPARAARQTTLTRVVPVAVGGTVLVVAFLALGFLFAQVVFSPTVPTETSVAAAPTLAPTIAPPTTLAPATLTPVPATRANSPIPPTAPPPTADVALIVNSTLNAINTANASTATQQFLVNQLNQSATARAFTATPTLTNTVVPTATNLPATVTPIPPTMTRVPTQIILPSPQPYATDTPAATATPDPDTLIREVTRTGTRTVVYAQPSTSSSQLVTLFVGDRLQLTGKTSGSGSSQWQEILLADNRSGWILVKADALKEIDPDATSPGFKIGVRVRVTAAGAGLNFRVSPSTSATRIKTLPEGTALVIIAGPKRGGFHTWWQFTLSDGTQGWIIDIPEWFQIY
jgi:serine/threonine-protein kinase